MAPAPVGGREGGTDLWGDEGSTTLKFSVIFSSLLCRVSFGLLSSISGQTVAQATRWAGSFGALQDS